MRKRYHIVVGGIIVASLLAGFARAQTSEHATGTKKMHREDVREERVQERQEKRSEIKTKLKEEARERIRSHAKRIVDRLTHVLSRLQNIATRIDARLAVLEGEETSVTDARAKLEMANGKIRDAKTAVEKIIPAVEIVIASDKPRENFANARAVIVAAHDALKAAHAALVDVINTIKPGVRKNSHPTTTPAQIH